MARRSALQPSWERTMTKLLSEDDYTVQRTELERAISYAQAEYHSASFKAQTGAIDSEGVKAAKDHLDALNASLEGLHAAWRGSQQASEDAVVAQRDAAFNALTADVKKVLHEREGKLSAILVSAEALAVAINAYLELTRSIRVKAVAYRTDHAPKVGIDPLFGVLAGGFGPYAIAGAVLAANGVQTTLLGGDRTLFDDRSALQMEQRLSELALGGIMTMAPKAEA